MKTLRKIKLHAVDSNGNQITSQTISDTVAFVGTCDGWQISLTKCTDGTINLHVYRGKVTSYRVNLAKHPTLNYYLGVTGKNNKCQVSIKKMVGELRVWV